MDSTTMMQVNSTLERFRRALDRFEEGVPGGRLSSLQIKSLVDDLPRIEEKKLMELGEKDSSCPICLTPYLTILTEEEVANAMDTPAHPIEELGITKLSQSWQCGHIFCRRDIYKWITGGHDWCPLCRRLLIEADSDGDRATEDELVALPVPEDWGQQLAGLTTEEVQRIMAEQDTYVGLRFPIIDGTDTQEPDNRNEYSGMYS